MAKIFDIFTTWLFNTKSGQAIWSLCTGILMTVLGYFSHLPYAPLSYGLIALVAAHLALVLLLLIKKLYGERLHKAETYIEFVFDGRTISETRRENVWGWRHISLNDGSTIIVACFDKMISANTIRTSLIAPSGVTNIPFTGVNYEQKYAIILLNLNQHGTYRIEYRYHGQA